MYSLVEYTTMPLVFYVCFTMYSETFPVTSAFCFL